MKGFDEKPFAEGNVLFHLLVSAQSVPRRLQPAALPYGWNPGAGNEVCLCHAWAEALKSCLCNTKAIKSRC